MKAGLGYGNSTADYTPAGDNEALKGQPSWTNNGSVFWYAADVTVRVNKNASIRMNHEINNFYHASDLNVKNHTTKHSSSFISQRICKNHLKDNFCGLNLEAFFCNVLISAWTVWETWGF